MLFSMVAAPVYRECVEAAFSPHPPQQLLSPVFLRTAGPGGPGDISL